jgi:hypothetical protein
MSYPLCRIKDRTFLSFFVSVGCISLLPFFVTTRSSKGGRIDLLTCHYDKELSNERVYQTSVALQRDCTAFYGDPRKAGWLHENTIDVPCPRPLHIEKTPVSHILIHKKCSESLTRVLFNIWDAVGHDNAKITAADCLDECTEADLSHKDIVARLRSIPQPR